jgi:hypothetical protein
MLRLYVKALEEGIIKTGISNVYNPLLDDFKG